MTVEYHPCAGDAGLARDLAGPTDHRAARSSAARRPATRAAAIGPAGRRRGSRAVAVLALTAVLAAVAVLLAPVGNAFTNVAAVGASLRQSPVYNDPTAEYALSDAQEQHVLDAISKAGTPVYVAVLPRSALRGYGTADNLLIAIKSATGLPGTYALVVGPTFKAGSTEFEAKDLAKRAYDQNRSAGPTAVLVSFIASVGDKVSGRSSSSSSGSATAGFIILGFFLLLLLLALGAILWAVRSSRRKKAAALADVRKVVDEDVTEFGEQVMAVDARDSRLDDAGRTDVQAALDAYERAKTQAEAMTDASQAGGTPA